MPPVFVLFVNRANLLPATALSYLENRLREEFQLEGIPIRILVRENSDNEKAGDANAPEKSVPGRKAPVNKSNITKSVTAEKRPASAKKTSVKNAPAEKALEKKAFTKKAFAKKTFSKKTSGSSIKRGAGNGTSRKQGSQERPRKKGVIRSIARSRK